MQNYSYNGNRNGTAFALMESIDASYKDLGAVCDSIRYRRAVSALAELESIASGEKAVYYRRNNTGFGSRHELGGKKGRYPIKAAKVIRRVLINAMANAKNKGYMNEEMIVIHAAANKKQILKRGPAKGVLYLGTGITGHTYGYSPARRSNLEYARVEIGLASDTEYKPNERVKRIINRHDKEDAKLIEKAQPVKAKRQPAKQKDSKAGNTAAIKPTAQEKRQAEAKEKPKNNNVDSQSPNKEVPAASK